MCMAPERKLLTGIEAARYFEVSPATLRRWAKAGLVPCVRLPNGRVKYDRAALEDLREASTNPAVQASA